MTRTRGGTRCGWLVLGLAIVWGAPVAAQESWDAVYLAGAKVGYIHTFVEPLKDKGRELLRVRVDMAVSFKRLENEVSMEFRYGTIETPDGTVLRLDTRTLASAQEMRAHGDVVDGKMTLILEGAGQAEQQTIPWGPEVRGPYAVEQSLSREPLKVGDTRTLKMFVPDFNKICDVLLTASGMEELTLGGGEKRTLLRVEQRATLDGKPRPELDVTSWVDSGGQVLKSVSEVMGGLVTYRTTKEAALKESKAKLDQITSSIIRVTHRITDPEKRRQITYRVSVKGDFLAELIPNDRRQTLRPESDRATGVLEVKTAGPEDGQEGPEEVDSEYLRPNAVVTSEDPKVMELAARAIGKETDPWQRAKKIEKWVAQNLKDKNFKTGFAPASEVARNLSGDCTEHGVLTAAMCRAVGVPARVVIGLVYADHLGGFGYHLWNEVYVQRRWVALDASFDQTDVDAVHVKLSETSLAGVSPYEAFLPVVRVLNKMTLEPLEIR
jgi:transglutaminase-like putative cysteine protease